MLENFIYENHLGQRFEGLKNGVYMNANELRNYSWSFDTINDRISRFYMSSKSPKLPLVVYCNTDEQAAEVKNRLLELTEVDIEAKQAGKVYIGEYYTYGYITESVKSDYLFTKRLCKLDLTLTSEADKSAWYRDEKTAFPKDSKSEEINEVGGGDYPYDYDYDYALSGVNRKIVCSNIRPSDFRLLIYGAISNPSVTIGGHTYTVNADIGKGETLLIDSFNKTITLTTATGRKVNYFDKRNRDSYIFEPIPKGQNTVVWNGTFGFDLTVIEKRSEPKWT